VYSCSFLDVSGIMPGLNLSLCVSQLAMFGHATDVLVFRHASVQFASEFVVCHIAVVELTMFVAIRN